MDDCDKFAKRIKLECRGYVPMTIVGVEYLLVGFRVFPVHRTLSKMSIIQRLSPNIELKLVVSHVSKIFYTEKLYFKR